MQKFIFRKNLLSEQSTYPCYLKRYRINSPSKSNHKNQTYNNHFTDQSPTQSFQLCWNQVEGLTKYPKRQKTNENMIDNGWIKKMSVKTHNSSNKVRNIKTALFGTSIKSNSIIPQKRSVDRFDDLYGNTIDFAYIKNKWIKRTKQLKQQDLSLSRSDRSQKEKQSKSTQQRKRHKALKKQFKNSPAVGDYEVNLDYTGKKIIRNVEFSIKKHEKHRKNQSAIISNDSDQNFGKINEQLKTKCKKNFRKEKSVQYLGHNTPNYIACQIMLENDKTKTKHVPMNQIEMNKVWSQTLKKYKISEANFACSFNVTD